MPTAEQLEKSIGREFKEGDLLEFNNELIGLLNLSPILYEVVWRWEERGHNPYKFQLLARRLFGSITPNPFNDKFRSDANIWIRATRMEYRPLE